MIAWRQSYAISPETARRLVDVILPELRARTQEFVDLPEERVDRDPHGAGPALERVQLVPRRWALASRPQYRSPDLRLPLDRLARSRGIPRPPHRARPEGTPLHRAGSRRARAATDQHAGVRDLGRDRDSRGEDAVRSGRAGPLSARARLPRCRDHRRSRARSRHRRRDSESCARFRATRRCCSTRRAGTRRTWSPICNTTRSRPRRKRGSDFASSPIRSGAPTSSPTTSDTS